MPGLTHLVTGLLVVVAAQLTTASVLPRPVAKTKGITTPIGFNLDFGKDASQNPLVGHFDLKIIPTEEDPWVPVEVELNGQPLIQDDAGFGHGNLPAVLLTNGSPKTSSVSVSWTFSRLDGNVDNIAALQQVLDLTVQAHDVIPPRNSTVKIFFTHPLPLAVSAIFSDDVPLYLSKYASRDRLEALYRQAGNVLELIHETEAYIVQNYGEEQLESSRKQSISPADASADQQMRFVQRPGDPNSQELKLSASQVISPAGLIETPPAHHRQPISWDDMQESLINLVGAFSIAAIAWVILSGGILLFHICRRSRIMAFRASQAARGDAVANEQGRIAEDASIEEEDDQNSYRGGCVVHRETQAERLARAHNQSSRFDVFKKWIRSLTNVEDVEKTAARQQEEHDRQQLLEADSADGAGEVETTMEEELARFRIAASMVDDIIAAGGSRAPARDDQQTPADCEFKEK
jgi:hypothetical protein